MAKEELINLQRLEDYSADMFRDANVLKRNTAYALNNAVCKGLIVLKCILAGTTNTTALSLSGVSVGDELTDGTAKWKVISINGYGTGGGTGAGLEDWESNHDYAVDDIYVYEGEIYKTIVKFTSGSTEDERTEINDVVPSVWAANTAYTAGDIIEHTDVTTLKKVYYNVTANFTSNATFEVTAEMQELQIVEEYVPNPLTKQQVKNLIDSFVPSGSGTDPIFYNDTPIGTIIAYMGITAPKDYLACNGQTYNIADYKELAEYIKVQFGSYNYFGGDGTTTFAVPDLRGEFLRGTGTNSHENQGSGANVGVHQDATEIPSLFFDSNGGNTFAVVNGAVSGTSSQAINIDGTARSGDGTCSYVSRGGTVSTPSGSSHYKSRPTNTSVLYCIKYNTSVLSTPENNYSTEEQRIGTWIDGKPLYQKTIYVGNLPNNGSLDITLGLPIDKMINMTGVAFDTGGSGYTFNIPMVRWDLIRDQIGIVYNGNASNQILIVTEGNASTMEAYVTIQYTKTTD